MIVALDGPSGAGKSTLAKAVAKELGFLYVDTGACYRAVALQMLENQVDIEDADAVKSKLDNVDIQLTYNRDGEQRVLLNGEDVSEKIRNVEVSQNASKVSAIPFVRQWLLALQRSMADSNNVIMDGRDIGTVVLPNADVKIFLTASPKERAKRRHLEYLAKGSKIEYNRVLEELLERDKRDTNRETAPLKKAENAVSLDSTDLSFDEALNAILSIIKDRKS